MPLNQKFLDKYGISYKDMSEETRWTVLMSEIFDLREEIAPVTTICKTVDRHSIYFTALWISLTTILIPTLVYTIKAAFKL